MDCFIYYSRDSRLKIMIWENSPCVFWVLTFIMMIGEMLFLIIFFAIYCFIHGHWTMTWIEHQKLANKTRRKQIKNFLLTSMLSNMRHNGRGKKSCWEKKGRRRGKRRSLTQICPSHILIQCFPPPRRRPPRPQYPPIPYYLKYKNISLGRI